MTSKRSSTAVLEPLSVKELQLQPTIFHLIKL